MPNLSSRLRPLEGLTAFMSSAEGGTLTAYRTLEAEEIGGRLNGRRAFTGLPGVTDPFTIWSTKATDVGSVRDRHLAFQRYAKPCVDIYWHEPDGSNFGVEFPDPGVWRTRSEAVLLNSPTNVARGACFKSQSTVPDGNGVVLIEKFLPTKPAWLDILLIDWYPKIDADGGGVSYKTRIDAIIHHAGRLGVPWGFAEFGLGGDGANAAARYKRMHEIVDYVCDNGRCMTWAWFGSSVGQSNTVYTGKSTWKIRFARDRDHPEMAKVWRDLAELMRNAGKAKGSTAAF